MTSVAAWPPVWWTLVRHEARLVSRDFFNFANRRKRGAPIAKKPRGRGATIAWIVLAMIVMHAVGLLVLSLPRTWRDTAATRLAVVALVAFLFTFMLSYTMSRIVAAFHERRDLDLMLAAPIDPRTVLAVRALSVVAAATVTFAIFVYPIADVGVASGRWWIARWYLVVPLLATIATSMALVLTDVVVRAIGVRRARVGLQIFSALVGASMYFVSQARNLLPDDTGRRMMVWFMAITHVDDAPWPVAAIAAVARGDPGAWLVFVLAAVGSFAAATAWSARRFVDVALTPEASSPVARPGAGVVGRRIATGFARGVFMTLLVKEWRLILRAPQLVSQVLLQLLYLMPLLFVAYRGAGSGAHVDAGGAAALGWGTAAFAAGVTGIASTLATSLAWLTVAAEDAPDLLAGSPQPRGTLLGAKLAAASAPPIAIVALAAMGVARAGTSTAAAHAAIVLAYGMLSCASAAILAAASPVAARRGDFQSRHKGRGVSAIVEGFQFLLWAGAAGAAAGGYGIVAAIVTILACVMPAIRLRQAMRRFDA